MVVLETLISPANSTPWITCRSYQPSSVTTVNGSFELEANAGTGTALPGTGFVIRPVATGGADALFDEYVEAINEGTVNKNSTATAIDASEILLNLG